MLRRRLKLACLVFAALLGLACLRNIFVEGWTVGAGMQGAGLLALLTFYLTLASSRKVSRIQLRVIEMLLFGGLFLAVAVAEWFELRQNAGNQEFDAVVVIRFFASFSLLILAYGMLMPKYLAAGQQPSSYPWPSFHSQSCGPR